MHSFLKKASKRLVEDPEHAPEKEADKGQAKGEKVPKGQTPPHSQGGAVHNAPTQHKKGTRKKI